jgi:hypothetical protein
MVLVTTLVGRASLRKSWMTSFGLVVFAFAETVVADTVTTRRAEAKD